MTGRGCVFIAAQRVHLDPDPIAAMVQLARARTEVDRAIVESVPFARAAGASWTTIARALGISRQAAQQRFTSSVPAPSQKETLDLGNDLTRQ